MSQVDQAKLIDQEAYHGGLDLRELARHGLVADDVIDFSSNILPQGPSPRVIAAIAAAAIDRYPDRESDSLKAEISKYYDVAIDRLMVGNGCSELIHLIAGTFLEPGDKALVIGPTFSEYARATRLAHATVEPCNASWEDSFTVPIHVIDERLTHSHYQMVWVCNPNNPTAQVIDRQRFMQWLVSYPDTWFVVDESYIEFSEHAESMLRHDYPNLIVLRSMTKSFAIAGVRLGFAALSRDACERLCGRRVPWNVSSLAQAAGIASLADDDYYKAALREIREWKAQLIDELAAAGLQVVPSDANFFLLKIKNTQAIREKLLSHGLVVRDCTSFGLDDCLRIATRDPVSNRRLVDVLAGRDVKVEAVSDNATKHPVSHFGDTFTRQLNDLFRKRRDVRRFRTDPIPGGSLERWVASACLAPSVGLSQPWRFVSVTSPEAREAVAAEFEQQNQLAAARYDDGVASKYRELKLAGLKEAPEQIAVFVEPDPAQGRGLGRLTMPEAVAYSVVAAIQNLWLAARAEGVGVGWVSILRPEQVATLLDVPESWQLVAYLCIGWPQVTDDEVPELEQLGWEQRVSRDSVWMER